MKYRDQDDLIQEYLFQECPVYIKVKKQMDECIKKNLDPLDLNEDDCKSLITLAVLYNLHAYSLLIKEIGATNFNQLINLYLEVSGDVKIPPVVKSISKADEMKLLSNVTLTKSLNSGIVDIINNNFATEHRTMFAIFSALSHTALSAICNDVVLSWVGIKQYKNESDRNFFNRIAMEYLVTMFSDTSLSKQFLEQTISDISMVLTGENIDEHKRKMQAGK